MYFVYSKTQHNHVEKKSFLTLLKKHFVLIYLLHLSLCKSCCRENRSAVLQCCTTPPMWLRFVFVFPRQKTRSNWHAMAAVDLQHIEVALQDLGVKTPGYGRAATEKASESETTGHLIESIYNNLGLFFFSTNPAKLCQSRNEHQSPLHRNILWNTRCNIADVECSLGYICVWTLHSSR